jgi:hypothetical protein
MNNLSLEERKSLIELVMKTLHPDISYLLDMSDIYPMIHLDLSIDIYFTMTEMVSVKQKIRRDMLLFINEKVIVVASMEQIKKFISGK